MFLKRSTCNSLFQNGLLAMTIFMNRNNIHIITHEQYWPATGRGGPGCLLLLCDLYNHCGNIVLTCDPSWHQWKFAGHLHYLLMKEDANCDLFPPAEPGICQSLLRTHMPAFYCKPFRCIIVVIGGCCLSVDALLS